MNGRHDEPYAPDPGELDREEMGQVIPLRRPPSAIEARPDSNLKRLHDLTAALGLAANSLRDPVIGVVEDAGGSPCVAQAHALVAAFARITDPYLRQRIVELVQAVAG